MTFVPASSLAASTVTVSGTVAVSSVAGTVAVDGSGVTQPVSGSVSVSNFPATQPVSGSVAVSNFPATQPVSGTVTANQGTAGSAWPISAAALPLPSGAATSAAQTDGTQRIGGTVIVDGSGVTQPVSGPLTNTQLRATAVAVDGSAVTQPVSVDSLPLPDGAATEDTLATVNGAVQDTALTSILEREKIPA